MSKRLGTVEIFNFSSIFLIKQPYYIAPEVLNQNYDEKCDLWSCGVILYILLCGYPPFGGSSENEILNKVKLGKYKFDGNIIFIFFDLFFLKEDDWSGISNEAKSLISKMLTYNPKERISANEALNDPWIQRNSTQNQVNMKALQNLQSFHVTQIKYQFFN